MNVYSRADYELSTTLVGAATRSHQHDGVGLSGVPHTDFVSADMETYTQQRDAKKKIVQARNMQHDRYGRSIECNSGLTARVINKHIELDSDANKLLTVALERLNLSASRYFQIIKVAQSIADLDENKIITAAHMSEALLYR